MLFGQDRDQLRRQFFEAWRKRRTRLPLTPLEQTIAGVIAMHPEYHSLLENEDRLLQHDYLPEEAGATNPFLHLGLHIALHEQLGTDRPAGIRDLARQLLLKIKDPHETEHRMMECLAETLWQSQRNHTFPDEQGYLNCLRNLLGH
ncbi:MAG: hypothetical protein A2V90_02255 [Gammaproteobacteria bacterium RBG_16_57_12]|nr:MAG: hypothetical protein A2V90_02255 [Gammaproteobacteria bacterium RBG_16_57_12]